MPDHVTLKAIGERVGYSKNTVSLALRGDAEIPPRTRRRIRKVAREMGYRPNALVSQLMSRLRSSHAFVSFRATLALVTARSDRDAATAAALADCVAGCHARAAQLGYRFDEFRAGDPDATASRWLRIFTTRGIQGVIVVGLPDDGQIPARLEPVWRRFPTVVAGLRPRGADLPFTSVDHFEVLAIAMRNALALGYRRPGLVVDDRADRRVGGRLGAGMLAAQQALPETDRLPALRDAGDSPADAFLRWYADHRPDVILGAHARLDSWLRDAGLRPPADVGLVRLDRPAGKPSAGIDQHHALAGQAAVDLMAGAIDRSKRPAGATSTLVSASWVDGETVRCRWDRLGAVDELRRPPGVAA